MLTDCPNNPPSSFLPHGHSTRCAYPKAKHLRPDMRTRSARRQKALRLAFVQALAAPDDRPYSRLPVMLRAAVDSAVALSMALERLSAAQARGEPTDPDAVVRTAGALSRAVETIEGIAARNRAAEEAARHAEEDRAAGVIR